MSTNPHKTCWDSGALKTRNRKPWQIPSTVAIAPCGSPQPFPDHTLTRDPSQVTCPRCQEILAGKVEDAMFWGGNDHAWRRT